MATKTIKKNKAAGKSKLGLTFTAVFENGVLRPLKKVRLPQHTEFIVFVHKQERSVADQIYGLCKPKNLSRKEMDEIIDSEDWL